MKIIAFQGKFLVNNWKYNIDKMLNFIKQNIDADLLIFPELAICGYSPLDSFFSPNFKLSLDTALQELLLHTKNLTPHLFVGAPIFFQDKLLNCLLHIHQGKILQQINKEKFPNNHVYSESRYFSYCNSSNIIPILDHKIAIFICEDLWHKDKVEQVMSCTDNINLIVIINASNFTIGKQQKRLNLAKKIVQYYKIPLLYNNLFGGVDEIIFDGGSFILNRKAILINNPMFFCENTISLELQPQNEIRLCTKKNYKLTTEHVTFNNCTQEQLIYQALITGLKDFLKAISAKGIIIGVSGGIDSALSLAIAADAIGSANILAVSMPSLYTSELSLKLIKQLLASLDIKSATYSIDNMHKNFMELLRTNDFIKLNNTTLENMQARIRGDILMSISNSMNGYIVLTTGNKSELATGYCTLYGDTCGAYNVLKDVYKTQVFALANWRNANLPYDSYYPSLNIIPQEIITRKPTAELKNDQYDEDNLLDYTVLDKILFSIIEKNLSYNTLYTLFNKNDVDKVISLINNSHYKRTQSSPGVNISSKPFSKDFKYNISSISIV